MPHVSYFWDEMEDNVVEEYDESGTTTASYTTEPTLYGSVLSQDRGGQKRYFHFDGQGNTSALTDHAGDVTDSRSYTAFGLITSAFGMTSLPLAWEAQWGAYNESGSTLYAIRRRVYMASEASWMSTDSISIRQSRIRIENELPFLARRTVAMPAWNSLYAYAFNDPLNVVDPSGLAEGKGIKYDVVSQTELDALKGCECGAKKITQTVKDFLGMVFCKDDKFQILQNPILNDRSRSEVACGYWPTVVVAHEKHHIFQFEKLCPNACIWWNCGVHLPPGDWFVFAMGWKTEECSRIAECYAYLTSLEFTLGLYNFWKAKPPGAPGRALCMDVGIRLLKHYTELRKNQFKCEDTPADLAGAITPLIE